MTQYGRLWFTDFPQTENEVGFAKRNHPTEATFKSLFESIPFFLEFSDRAKLATQGLAMIATDEHAYTFVSNDDENHGTDFIRPHQLPELLLDGESLTDDAYVYDSGIGIKRTKPSRTGGNGIAYRFVVGIDDNIFAYDANEKLTFANQNGLDANIVYLLKYEDGVLGYQDSTSLLTEYWEEVNPYLQTKNQTQSVKIGIGTIISGSLRFLESGNREISVEDATAGSGSYLLIRAGHATGTGYNGGNVHIFGGDKSSGGEDGDVLLNYSPNGPSVIGVTAIGGSPDATYQLKVHGNFYPTGLIHFGTNGTGTELMGWFSLDENGDLRYVDSATLRDDIFPSGASAQILIYNNGWGAVSVSGDIEAAVSGALTIKDESVTNAKIHPDSDLTLLFGCKAAGVIDNDLQALENINLNMLFGSTTTGVLKGFVENTTIISDAILSHDVTTDENVIFVNVNTVSGITLNFPSVPLKTNQRFIIIIETNDTGQDIIFAADGMEEIQYHGTGFTSQTINLAGPGSYFTIWNNANGKWSLISHIEPYSAP